MTLVLLRYLLPRPGSSEASLNRDCTCTSWPADPVTVSDKNSVQLQRYSAFRTTPRPGTDESLLFSGCCESHERPFQLQTPHFALWLQQSEASSQNSREPPIPGGKNAESMSFHMVANEQEYRPEQVYAFMAHPAAVRARASLGHSFILLHRLTHPPASRRKTNKSFATGFSDKTPARTPSRPLSSSTSPLSLPHMAQWQGTQHPTPT